MDDAKREALKAAGIDVEDAVRRFMGKEELMMKFLLRFGQDPNFGLLRQALEEGDTARAYEAAHALKGLAGNLSLRVVFARSSELVDSLRAGDLQQAKAGFPALEESYRAVLDAIG